MCPPENMHIIIDESYTSANLPKQHQFQKLIQDAILEHESKLHTSSQTKRKSKNKSVFDSVAASKKKEHGIGLDGKL